MLLPERERWRCTSEALSYYLPGSCIQQRQYGTFGGEIDCISTDSLMPQGRKQRCLQQPDKADSIMAVQNALHEDLHNESFGTVILKSIGHTHPSHQLRGSLSLHPGVR